MTVKIIGALLIVFSCSAFGFIMVYNHRSEVFALEQLVTALDYMQSELNYNLTPLPELCRKTASVTKGVVQKLFQTLFSELENRISPNTEQCMRVALHCVKNVPEITKACFERLSLTLGKFELEGQERSLRALRIECREKLANCKNNQDARMRSYQTLGICAGVALAIIFI